MTSAGKHSPSHYSDLNRGAQALPGPVLYASQSDHSTSLQWLTDLRLREAGDAIEAVDALFPFLAAEDPELGRSCASFLAELLCDVTFERFASPPPEADLRKNAPMALLPALAGLNRLAQHVADALLAGTQNPDSVSRLCGALGSQPAVVAALSALAINGRIPGLDRFPTLFESCGSRYQLSLSPTYHCRGACTYCYSSGLVDRFPQDMGIESLRQVVMWMRRNNVGLLLLAGGEPTEYLGINELFELLKREHIRAYLATHNIFERSLDSADREVLERVSVHLWHRHTYSPPMWDCFKRNLEMWCTKGVTLSLRYNLLDPDDHPRDLFEVCDQFDIHHISIGLAFPSLHSKSVPKEDFELYAPLLADMCQESQRAGVSIRLAKPLPWCAFNEEQLRLLKRVGLFSAVCSIHHQRGTRNVVVNPDLSTYACQAFTNPGKNLLSMPTVNDLAEEYEDTVSAALLQPLYHRCIDCYYYVQRACQGACLAYKVVPGSPAMSQDYRP